MQTREANVAEPLAQRLIAYVAGASSRVLGMRWGEDANVGRRAALGVKRGIDLLGAGVGLVVLSPVLATVAIGLAVTQGRPVFFRHVRPGFRAIPFTMLKFRTMRPPRADEVWYGTDEQRVTWIGRLLRATSFDELPELLNVLRGDMSLVGPRPLLMEYLSQYTPAEQRRHDMPPGITGWAAVNGRHELKFKERLEQDVWYVDHWNLWLDLRILALTVIQVLRHEGVSTVQDVKEIGFPLPAGAPAGAAHSSGGGAREASASRQVGSR